MEMTFGRIEDRPINFVSVQLITELDCNPKDDEYTLYISGLIGSLNITPVSGMDDDISLIRECIVNDLDFDKLPKEGVTNIILVESGEWEDMSWHKYYEIVRVSQVW